MSLLKSCKESIREMLKKHSVQGSTRASGNRANCSERDSARTLSQKTSYTSWSLASSKLRYWHSIGGFSEPQFVFRAIYWELSRLAGRSPSYAG